MVTGLRPFIYVGDIKGKNKILKMLSQIFPFNKTLSFLVPNQELKLKQT